MTFTLPSRHALAALALAASACAPAAAAPASLPSTSAAPASVRIVQRLQAAEAQGMPALQGQLTGAARAALAARGVRLRVLRFGRAATRVSSQWPEPGAPLPADGVAVVWVGAPPAPPAGDVRRGHAPAGDPAPAASAATTPAPAPSGAAPAASLAPAAYDPPPAPQPPPAPRTGPAAVPAPSGATSEPDGGGALTGTASWYGPGFEGRRTACGGRFDPDALTLASRELACGTKVTVTAPSGRSVDATVTDYGPAAWTSRRFDLSRATFAAVASLGAGTVQVRVELR